MENKDYWYVELTPSGNFLNNYKSFVNDMHYCIVDDDSMPLNFSLHSIHFENKNLEEIKEITHFIIALINGHCQLTFIDTKDIFKVGSNYILKNGNRELINSTQDYNFLDIDRFINVNPIYKPQREKEKIINLGFENTFIRHVLLHSNNGWSFSNMYRISDEILTFLKENNDNYLNYINKNDFNSFGATTNNFCVSGLEARHGSSSVGKTPKNTMSFDECSDFIRQFLNSVIEKYFDTSLIFIQ